jgi:hypothetical protein
MTIEHLPEPELEFGDNGTHIDMRFGLMQHGPVDRGTPGAPSLLHVGIIGSPETTIGVRNWLERARGPIPAKQSKRPNLFPGFPGFSESSCFGSSLVLADKWCLSPTPKELAALLPEGGVKPTEAVERAVDLFVNYAAELSQKGGPAVVVCAPPADLLQYLDHLSVAPTDPQETELDEGQDGTDRPHHLVAFHDLLKARAMRIGIPIQMIRPQTFGASKGSRRRDKKIKSPIEEKRLQDEATRAWNLHVALYYKAGGALWRLKRFSADFTTCFVGISFYRSLQGDRLLTSVAQVFNERGEGVIVKGGPATLGKNDRQPHLTSLDAFSLLKSALDAYRREHRAYPARVVVHKTSGFSVDEASGFSSAASDERLDYVDLVHVRRSNTRLFRNGEYPPLRGTLLCLDDATALLYLRGSVDFFQCYPGLYVPRPVELRVCNSSTPLRNLAVESLALSKLNWNNSQFDGGEPITVRAARRVGEIMKCLPPGEMLQNSFRYFI